MPEVAAALRSRSERIVKLWTRAVEKYLPDADPLTAKQVRNSIPNVLEKIALALESGRPEETEVLTEVGTAHGVARFQQQYKVEEVIIEYRLLRRIVFDELYAASAGNLTFLEAVAVDMAIDVALQRGVGTFVRYLTEELQSAAASELKYLSFLSHDLRNNLNGVTLTLEWIARRLSTRAEFVDDARDMEALRQSVVKTVEGMDRLLQAERLRRQAVTLKLRPVELRSLVADLLAQVSRLATEKGLKLENTVPLDAAAHSDRELLTLAVQNLLGNAVKYSQQGVVQVSAVRDTLGWRLAISDEGPGIAPERINTLFKAFSRGESHGQSGVGLGLAIASHAARLLGSELKVDSTLGKGSTFSFAVTEADVKTAT
jgi:signal transduction histidine kinase